MEENLDINGKWELVLTQEEAMILWKWLKHQSLPYDNYELKALTHQLGNIVEDSK